MHGQPTQSPSFAYRHEIDGLRAIAVMAVVLFHARLGCRGGYVGVDVFFVISGYLITSLILRDLDSGRFRMVEFWERRIRRIVPALTVAISLTLAAGWWLHLPDDFHRLGKAVIAQGLVLSNLYHGWVTDYFSPRVDAFPLMHTWSLAVEEQFYIALPLILVAMHRWKPQWIRPGLVVACLLSLVLGVAMTAYVPRISFYVLPARAWELLLGSILAAYPRWGEQASSRLREVMGWAGLLAIGTSILLFHEKIPFPGIPTLLPTLGTVAFIWANRTLTSSGRFLAMRPFVYVGQVSYSYYLLHWPVIAYADYWFFKEMSWGVRSGLMLAAFLAAVVSYSFVETPFRKGMFLTRRNPLFVSALCSTMLLIAVGFALIQTEGVRERFDDQALAYLPPDHETKYFGAQIQPEKVMQGELFEFGDRTANERCLLWGDSHAMALLTGLDEACHERSLHGLAATYSSTAPLLGFVSDGFGLGSKSTQFNEAVVQQAIDRQVTYVVMAAAWCKYSDNPRFGPALQATVDHLTGAGIEVILVRDVPMLPDYGPRMLIKAIHFDQPEESVGLSLEAHREKNRTADWHLAQVEGPHVTVVDPTPFLSDSSGFCRAALDGEANYRDSDHLSAAGARRLKSMFWPVLQTAVSRDAPEIR